MNTDTIQIESTTLNKFSSQRAIGIITIFSGILIASGALLPWFSLYAGLQSYQGIIGLNGRIMLGMGIFSGLMGLFYYLKGGKIIRLIITFFGVTLLLFSAWLLFGLWETYQKLLAEPLLIPKLGPGLFVSGMGTIILFSTIFLNKFNRHSK